MSTKSTYKMLTKNLDRIADDLHQIGEQNNLGYRLVKLIF